MLKSFIYFWISTFILIMSYSLLSFNLDGDLFRRKTADYSYQTSDLITVKRNVPLQSYFRWMDSVLVEINESESHYVDEYTLVHANSWIIDTLRNTDYYHLFDQGVHTSILDTITVIRKGQQLLIPDLLETIRIQDDLSNTMLDLNIPEFRLRIFQHGKELFKMPVRVGQNKRRYLAMADARVDLRTRVGTGQIVRVNKDPVFINPKDNHRYYATRRDDGTITDLPVIPWLEPEINGIRYGQLIHPTTNLETLNKASSNGCVGLRESDAWRVYYYAPLGTKVVFRYQLLGVDNEGYSLQFEDIYPGYDEKLERETSKDVSYYKQAIDGQELCDCRIVNNNLR